MIGDILDIARIESGRLSLSPKRANLRELVESVARVFEGLARQKRLTLILDIDSSINCDVLVDALRFKQILSNLVSNAIKFTEEGSITVSISGRLVDNSLLHVHLSVKDTGVGISPADQQHLFRPFAQVQRNLQRTEGTGLGLVICRSLCEMMGGRVTMSSAVGRGTLIDVELHLQVLERVYIPQVPALPSAKQRYCLQVLVVDDHQINRRVLHEQLKFLGHDVCEAEDGQRAFERWREQPFDVVITDCHMPVMNGVELTRAIRRTEREEALEATVVLGLTADAQQEEIEQCINAGMNDCLIKPISLDELDAKLLALPHNDDADSECLQVGGPAEPASLQLIDLGPLGLLLNSDPVKFREILDELISNNRRDCQSLRVLLDEGDIDKLGELIHRIKGAARVVKGEQLVEACRRLEVACTTPQTRPASVAQAVREVEQAINDLERALEAFE